MAKPDPRCYINHTNKYILINIPKNASTSLRNTIEFDIFTDYKTIENPDECIKFIILRNPIKRAISFYLEVKKLRRDGPYQTTMSMPWFKVKNVTKSFKMFIDEIGDNFYDPHVLPQVNFLKDKKLSIDDMDMVLLHENLSEDYNKLIAKFPQIKTKNNLQKLQVGNNQIKDILIEYTNTDSEICDRIREVYSEDFELYSKFTT